MKKNKNQHEVGALRISSMDTQTPYGFTASHFILIAVCLFMLVGFSVVTGKLTWSTLTNLNPLRAASEQDKPLTYEQIKAQVDSSYKINYTTTDQKTQEQLAEVDPAYGIGEVLGASTENIPSADAVFSQQQLQSIPLNIVTVKNTSDLQLYSDKLHFVENYYGVSELLQAFSNQDATQLNKAEPVYMAIISELKAMPVPAQFVEYQRYKILYYSSLVGLIHAMTAQADTDDTSAGTLFFSLQDKMSSMQTELSQKYGIQL